MNDNADRVEYFRALVRDIRDSGYDIHSSMRQHIGDYLFSNYPYLG